MGITATVCRKTETPSPDGVSVTSQKKSMEVTFLEGMHFNPYLLHQNFNKVGQSVYVRRKNLSHQIFPLCYSQSCLINSYSSHLEKSSFQMLVHCKCLFIYLQQFYSILVLENHYTACFRCVPHQVFKSFSRLLITCSFQSSVLKQRNT